MPTENKKQEAAAQLSIAIGHLDACLHLWSPGTGMSPVEYKNDPEVQAWKLLQQLVNQIIELHGNDGPGA